jgi:hypothetical protein
LRGNDVNSGDCNNSLPNTDEASQDSITNGDTLSTCVIEHKGPDDLFSTGLSADNSADNNYDQEDESAWLPVTTGSE